MRHSPLFRSGLSSMGIAALLSVWPMPAEAGLTVVTSVPVLNPSRIYEAVIDPIHHVGFIAAGSDPFNTHYGNVIEVVNLTTMQVITSIPLPVNGIVGGAAVIDTADGFAYFAGEEVLGNTVIYQIDTNAYTLVRTLAVPSLAFITSGVVDTQGFAYFGGQSSSANEAAAIKMDIRPASPTPFQQSTLDLGSPGQASAAVVDNARGLIYFGTSPLTGKNTITSVNIAGGAFNNLASLLLQSNEIVQWDAAVLDANGNAYFSVSVQPNSGTEILQIAPGLSGRQVVLPLPGQAVTRAAIDAAAGFAFFYSPVGNTAACVGAPCVARVYQMNVSAANGAIGQLFDGISIGNSDFYSATFLIDPAAAHVYVGKTFSSQASFYEL